MGEMYKEGKERRRGIERKQGKNTRQDGKLKVKSIYNDRVRVQ